MKAGTQWTEAEDRLIATYFPVLGREGTQRKLESEGFHRTVGAVKARASNLGVRKLERKSHTDEWEPREIEILAEVYPTQGARKTSEVLTREGYARTTGSVRVKAFALGIRNNRRNGGESKQIGFCVDKELDVDVMERLEQVDNKSEYIRELIRRDARNC